MDYTKFSIEQLASTESFIDWVNYSDPEAVKFWDLYILENPEIGPKVIKARDLVSNLKVAQKTLHDTGEMDALWDRIEQRVGKDQSIGRPSPNKRMAIAVASASFLAMFSVIIYSYFIQQDTVKASAYSHSYENIRQDYVEQVNETGKLLTIALDDGSVVRLENRSRLKYKAGYENDSTRDVYLVGGAFFEVSKNPYRPFIVHSGEVLTKVLGTSFFVSAPENAEKITVSVKTGKVSVYALTDDRTESDSKNKNGVILVPNQEVTYERKQQLFEKRLVALPSLVDPVISSQDFTFENAPIAEVFKKLQLAYGIEIVFDEDTMEHCYITAPLGSESIYEKLKIICQTIGASYEIIDAKIVISSSGC